MADDKVFELMESLYVEFRDFKKDITEFKNETRSSFLRLENYTVENFKALNDRFDVVENKFDTLIEQISTHEGQIKVLKKAVE